MFTNIFNTYNNNFINQWYKCHLKIKKKLDIIRKKLDNLDNKFLALIKTRTFLVNEVLKLKEFKSEIIDKKRINFILNKIKQKSKNLK